MKTMRKNTKVSNLKVNVAHFSYNFGRLDNFNKKVHSDFEYKCHMAFWRFSATFGWILSETSDSMHDMKREDTLAASWL